MSSCKKASNSHEMSMKGLTALKGVSHTMDTGKTLIFHCAHCCLYISIGLTALTLLQLSVQLHGLLMTNLHRADRSAVGLLEFNWPVSDILAYQRVRNIFIARSRSLRTIHFLPSFQKIFWVRKCYKTVFRLFYCQSRWLKND